VTPGFATVLRVGRRCCWSGSPPGTPPWADRAPTRASSQLADAAGDRRLKVPLSGGHPDTVGNSRRTESAQHGRLRPYRRAPSVTGHADLPTGGHGHLPDTAAS